MNQKKKNRNNLILTFILWVVVTYGFGYCMYHRGKEVSFRKGFDLGYDFGYKRGHKNGHIEGYQKGDSIGYAHGFKKGSEGNYLKVWDVLKKMEFRVNQETREIEVFSNVKDFWNDWGMHFVLNDTIELSNSNSYMVSQSDFFYDSYKN